MKNALIIYSAPAFLLNVPMSWEIFLNIKSQVKFKHYFSPDFQLGHLTRTCSRMPLMMWMCVAGGGKGQRKWSSEVCHLILSAINSLNSSTFLVGWLYVYCSLAAENSNKNMCKVGGSRDLEEWVRKVDEGGKCDGWWRIARVARGSRANYFLAREMACWRFMVWSAVGVLRTVSCSVMLGA